MTTPTAPLTLGSAPGVESCVAALAHALQREKGWLHGYADSLIRDAIDRVHLDAAPEIAAIREALPVVAHATTDRMRSITETELALIPNTLSNKGRRDRCRAMYLIPLVTLTEAQSALSAQTATIAQLEARLREAEIDARRLDHLQSRGATVDLVPDGSWWKFRIGGIHSAQSPNIRAAIDAAIAAHGKDGAHDR
jgi:hypothetical protein